MKKADLKIGELYVIDHHDRAELLEDLGQGEWRVRYLDSPKMNMETWVSSSNITRPWIPTAAHLKNRASHSWSTSSTGDEHDRRLKATAVSLAEELETGSSQAIREIGWQLPDDQYDPEGQGLIELSIPEEMAERIIRALKQNKTHEDNGSLGELLS